MAAFPLPVDVLNVMCSFIGDRHHYLKCDSLPEGNLGQASFHMQSRTDPSKRSRSFCYRNHMHAVLYVIYGDEVVHEEPPSYKNRLERLKAWRDISLMSPTTTAFLEKEIRAELAKKFRRNIGRMKLRTFVGH